MNEIYLDELTGCYNRRFLFYWVDNEIKRSNRYTMKFSLMLLDLDNFSDINNNFGHLEGDKVLIEFTEFLRKNVREVDHVVRYGGDEFIILVPNAATKGVHKLAQRILLHLNEEKISNHNIRCSIGFSVFPHDGISVEDLFNQADNLMYQAKKQGKNRIGVKEKIIRKLQIPSPVTIGRKDEANWCLDQIKQYNAIFVAGEIGVGKTRLVLETKDHLNSAIFLRGNAYAALSSVPYHPFKNMFNELIDKHFALVQRVFKQLPGVYQAEVMKLMPSKGKLKASQIRDLDKYRLYNAVAEFILKMADVVSPVVTMLLLDDLHWMDRPSCELLDFLIRSSNGKIKIFGTYRVEEIKMSQFSKFLGIWARERFYSQITVPPLNENQTHQLLKTIVGSVPQTAAKFIYHESGGNPFFIEEIVRALEQQKKLYWGIRGWVFGKNLKVTIPTSVEETIKRKLTFLEPRMKKFLEIAAVFGHEFDGDIIATASKRNVGEILQAFDELRRVGFITERTEENFFFSEDIVRQVVFKNISRSDLMRYHKLVGETIENFYRSSLPIYFEQLAIHFTVANVPRKALYYSKRAALKAKENYAHSLAIKFFENALKYEKNSEDIFKMRFSLADICFWTGDYKRTIHELITCLKIKPNEYKAYEQLGLVYANIGDYKNSLKYYRRGLKLAQKTDDVYKFRIRVARVYWRTALFLRAKNECEDILKNIKDMKKSDIGLAYLTLGVVFLRLDKLDKAESYLKKALKIYRRIDDKNHIAACYQDLALCCRRKFNTKACESYLKKALAIDKKIGYLGGIVIARINLGALYSDYNLVKAEEYYLEGLSTAKLIGAKRHIALLHNNLGHLYRYRLMDEQALNNFKRSLKLAKEIDYDEIVISSNLSLSETFREKGKLDRGKKHLKAAQKITEKLNLRFSIIACMMEEVHYLLDSRNVKRLTSVSEKMRVALKHERDLSFKVYGLIYQARVMVKLKKYSKARMYYERAKNLLKSSPNNVIVGEIYYLEGIAYKKEHKLKQALEMLQRASRIFEAVGNLRYLDKVQKEIAKIHIK